MTPKAIVSPLPSSSGRERVQRAAAWGSSARVVEDTEIFEPAALVALDPQTRSHAHVFEDDEVSGDT